MLVYDTRMQAWTRWVFKAATDGALTQGHSCGAVRVSDDLLFLGQWNVGGTDSYVFKERRAYARTDYKDDTVDQAIACAVSWNACTNTPEKSTHWHQLHLFHDISTIFTDWGAPSALNVEFTADRDSFSGTGVIALAPTTYDKMSRCGVPQSQRRSVRLLVTVRHAVANEYFGLEGMALVHRPPESYAGTKT